MLVKIFERKWVIQLFGLALILAPFFNTANSVLELPNIEKKYLIFYCWQFFKSAPFPQQALQTASLVIGVLMLRGSVSAWKYALGLLGGYIVLQFTQLNANLHDNTSWIYLGINIVFFFFIADQIVLKPRVAKPEEPKKKKLQPVFETPVAPAVAPLEPATSVEPAAPAPTPQVSTAMQTDSFSSFGPYSAAPEETPKTFEQKLNAVNEFTATDVTISQPFIAPRNNVSPLPVRKSSKKVYVNFEGFGNWGLISDISDKGIKVRAIAPAPPQITSKTIELLIASVNLRLKFYQQDGAEYTFNFITLSPDDKRALNKWLTSTVAS